jgi:hypothetical protein
VRRARFAILFALLLVAVYPCFSQSANRPSSKRTGSEPLGEKDASYAGSGNHKHKLFSKGIFGPKKGFDHSKSTQHFTSARKQSRSAFQNKKYTGKKGLFGMRKSSGWGGKASRTSGKEDKRLFKGQRSKRRKR